MKIHASRVAVIVFMAVLALAVPLVISRPAASQNVKTPMTADGHPNLSGYWGAPGNGVSVGGKQFERDADGSVLYENSLVQGNDTLCTDDSCQAPNQPPYNAKYMAMARKVAGTEFAGTSPEDPMTRCKPLGLPRTNPGNVLIFQNPQMIALMHGDYTDRVIYIDGRPHPPDMESTYMGDSIGHWEGNTLVVDVAGLNDDTWLGSGGATGNTKYTTIHSDKEHVIERWTREGDTITIEATIEDPDAFTKPWVIPTRKIAVASSKEYFDAPIFCDGSGIGELMRQHYVRPDPEDRDIKYKCSAHRCDPSTATANCGLLNKQNCAK